MAASWTAWVRFQTRQELMYLYHVRMCPSHTQTYPIDTGDKTDAGWNWALNPIRGRRNIAWSYTTTDHTPLCLRAWRSVITALPVVNMELIHLIILNSLMDKCPLILILFLSMEWDYVSELHPRTGLLFIPQMIHGYEEPWWNDTKRGKPKNWPKNMSQWHFVQHKSQIVWVGCEPEPPLWEAVD
jgi:hypothetical protein